MASSSQSSLNSSSRSNSNNDSMEASKTLKFDSSGSELKTENVSMQMHFYIDQKYR